MKCINCGCEIENGAKFCILCGTKVQNDEGAAQQFSQQPENQAPHGAGNFQGMPVNPVFSRVMSMLRDNLFLTLCILISASCGLSLIAGNLPLLMGLCVIFLWIIFAKSRKGIADSERMRCISGTIFASYVIRFVLFGIVGAGAILCAVAFAALGASGLMDEIFAEINPYVGEYAWFLREFSAASAAVIVAILAIVSVVGIILNVFGIRAIHKFAQSLYMSVESGCQCFVKCGAAKTWLMVFGILSATSALGGVFSGNAFVFLSSGCEGAAMIVGSILIGKYFSDCK